MIVDDDFGLRQMMRLTLERAGHLVTEADDGSHVMSILASGQRVDAVIVDLFMPGKDGIATIRDLRRLHPALPILAISGGGEIRDIGLLQAAQGLGANATLLKPFEMSALRLALDDLVSATGCDAKAALAPGALR